MEIGSTEVWLRTRCRVPDGAGGWGPEFEFKLVHVVGAPVRC